LSIEKALEVAKRAHRGQKDKAGVDYILHPLAVAGMLETEKEKTIALLHDVVEDSNITLDDLKSMGFDDDVIQAVKVLTKDGSEYSEYLQRVKINTLTRTVKIADLSHNMDLSRIPNPTEDDYQRIEKYKKSIKFLKAD